MADLRWGMIGSSGWADHTFAPAVARARGNKLVAVLGSTAGGAQGFAERHGIARAHAHTELKALLADAAVRRGVGGESAGSASRAGGGRAQGRQACAV